MCPRVLTFADGFTSASAPDVVGGEVAEYSIANNLSSATNVTGFLFDDETERSVFVEYQLTRADDTPASYIQSGSFILVYDAGWSMEFGPYVGDALIQDSITSTEHVVLTVTSGGQIQVATGNMTGANHSCVLRVAYTRIQT